MEDISDEKFKNLTIRDLRLLGFKIRSSCPLSSYPESCLIFKGKYAQLRKEFRDKESELFYEIPKPQEPIESGIVPNIEKCLDKILHRVSLHVPPLDYVKRRLSSVLHKAPQHLPPSKYVIRRTDEFRLGRFLRKDVEMPNGCKRLTITCRHCGSNSNELVTLFNNGLKSVGEKIECTDSDIIYIKLKREECRANSIEDCSLYNMLVSFARDDGGCINRYDARAKMQKYIKNGGLSCEHTDSECINSKLDTILDLIGLERLWLKKFCPDELMGGEAVQPLGPYLEIVFSKSAYRIRSK